MSLLNNTSTLSDVLDLHSTLLGSTVLTSLDDTVISVDKSTIGRTLSYPSTSTSTLELESTLAPLTQYNNNTLNTIKTLAHYSSTSSATSSTPTPSKTTRVPTATTALSSSESNEYVTSTVLGVYTSEVLVTITETSGKPEDTVAVPAQQTVYYTQPYEITADSTTLTTELPFSTVIPATASLEINTQATKTADFNFLAALEYGMPSSSLSNQSSNNTSTATIAGSVVGSVVGVTVIMLLIWLFMRRRRGGRIPVEKRSFSHEIASTRRYDGTQWDLEEDSEKAIETPNTNSGQYSAFSFIPGFSKQEETATATATAAATTAPDDDLASLKSSILNNQDLQSAPPLRQKPAFANLIPSKTSHKARTIDTVFEDSEFGSAAYRRLPQTGPLPSTSPQQRRYQNSGLKLNPFNNSIVPPVPPQRRKNGTRAEDYQRHGNNRASIASAESSILSEDTGDDVSTDDSLVPFGEEESNPNRGNSSTGGFFKEVV